MHAVAIMFAKYVDSMGISFIVVVHWWLSFYVVSLYARFVLFPEKLCYAMPLLCVVVCISKNLNHVMRGSHVFINRMMHVL